MTHPPTDPPDEMETLLDILIDEREGARTIFADPEEQPPCGLCAHPFAEHRGVGAHETAPCRRCTCTHYVLPIP
jgi:hypothetical protein